MSGNLFICIFAKIIILKIQRMTNIFLSTQNLLAPENITVVGLLVSACVYLATELRKSRSETKASEEHRFTDLKEANDKMENLAKEQFQFMKSMEELVNKVINKTGNGQSI
ncbi:hypothetical protein PANI_CDS0103 [Maribacter phage Panino]